MIRLATTTRLATDAVIQAAVAFFGPGGVGLTVKECEAGCASFEGAGGYVTVAACPAEGGTQVIVDAREWETDARRFLAQI